MSWPATGEESEAKTVLLDNTTTANRAVLRGATKYRPK